MAHDVFISHSSKDKPTADAVCAVLEAQKIRCWAAPRDIIPGKDWGESIVEAIKGSRVMVLIFSANANNSSQIKREVERAASRNIPIIPMRIEDVVPTASLEFFLSTPHWLDAFTPPLENHLQHLAQVVRQIVGVVPVETSPVSARAVGAVAPEKTEAPKPAPAETSPVPSPPVIVARGRTEASKAAPVETSPVPSPVVGAVAPEKTEAPLTTGERWSRILIHVGSIAMMVGLLMLKALTPVVVLGSGLVALGTFCGPSERRLVKYRVGVFILIGLGVGALWVLDAIGLLQPGDPNWWWALILLYPIGWYMGVLGPGTPLWVLLLLIPVGLFLLAVPVAGMSREALGSDLPTTMFFATVGALTFGGSIIRLWKLARGRK